MVIQPELVRRVEDYVDSLRKQKKYEHILFTVKQSKTTRSLYVQLFSRMNGQMIRLTYRFSDHLNSKVKTTVIKKTTSFKLIERKINAMLKSMKKIRFKMWCEEEAKKNAAKQKKEAQNVRRTSIQKQTNVNIK